MSIVSGERGGLAHVRRTVAGSLSVRHIFAVPIALRLNAAF